MSADAIMTHDSESRGHVEVACLHIFRPAQPLQYIKLFTLKSTMYIVEDDTL